MSVTEQFLPHQPPWLALAISNDGTSENPR